MGTDETLFRFIVPVLGNGARVLPLSYKCSGTVLKLVVRHQQKAMFRLVQCLGTRSERGLSCKREKTLIDIHLLEKPGLIS